METRSRERRVQGSPRVRAKQIVYEYLQTLRIQVTEVRREEGNSGGGTLAPGRTAATGKSNI